MARAPAAIADDTAEPDPADLGIINNANDPAMDEAAEPTSTVVVTICKSPEGGYIVYAGDEQEADEGQPVDGMEEGSPNAGTPVDGMGAALHRAMEILQDDAEGADGQGGAQAQFNAGFAGEGGQS